MEKIDDKFTVLRMALVLEFIDTPTVGGAAPRVAPTLRKRGPPTPRKGLGGRLPTWTLSYRQQTCKNKLTTPGTCRASGPAARRAAAGMAMAPMEAAQATRPEATKSEREENTVDALAANLRNTDLTTAVKTTDVKRDKGLIGTYTPLHSGDLGGRMWTYSMFVCCPLRAARGAAGT
jgi:hypothetical protein